ncbi:EDD domain protein, DegV family [Lentilactobacillus senioris DSM 24302 = JCM 17472]|uniref:EDD domain protein, DegV family n=2 Tax=Lentilactobacillus senioris TaxID=931534 RepID=A0A0R2CRB6_9LACO|nr:EDD domain protein, DegV family [Lentilactobacillus senioris DSM 24302 = JCM 17472]
MDSMANIKIVTDSSAGLTEEEIKQYDITIIPLTVMIDDTIYVEHENITNDEFIDKMLTSKTLPKTSQPPVGKFVDVFNELGADGSQILSINMTETISGTVHSAEQAATLSSSDVTVIDSQTTDRDLAFQVIAAAKKAQTGADMQAVIAETEFVRDHSFLYMGVMTLDNIVKGGRLHPVAGAITNFLNIKLVLEVTDGKIKILSKGRGNKSVKKFFQGVLADMQSLENIQQIGISYVTESELITELVNQIKQAFPTVPFVFRKTTPIIATHAGEGAFALMYYNDPR